MSHACAAESADAVWQAISMASWMGRGRWRCKRLAERFALQKLHHEVWRVTVGQEAHVDDVDDVGVTDGGGGTRLVHESGHQYLVLHQLGVEQLHRSLAPGEGMARKVHGAHSAFADYRDDFVVVEAQTDHDGISRAELNLTAFPPTRQGPSIIRSVVDTHRLPRSKWPARPCTLVSPPRS